MRYVIFIVGIGLVIGVQPLAADTWETVTGVRYEGTLSSLHGPLVVIQERTSVRVVPVDELNDASLARVADVLTTNPAQAPEWRASTSPVAKALKGRLHILRGDKLVDFDTSGM